VVDTVVVDHLLYRVVAVVLVVVDHIQAHLVEQHRQAHLVKETTVVVEVMKLVVAAAGHLRQVVMRLMVPEVLAAMVVLEHHLAYLVHQ
jgi:hypothetical protein